MKLYSFNIRGRRKEWGFPMWAKPEHVEDWRNDGLDFDEILGSVPAWYVHAGLPVSLWFWIQEKWQAISKPTNYMPLPQKFSESQSYKEPIMNRRKVKFQYSKIVGNEGSYSIEWLDGYLIQWTQDESPKALIERTDGSVVLVHHDGVKFVNEPKFDPFDPPHED